MEKKRSQNLPLWGEKQRHGRKPPAVYRLTVAGVIDPDWSDRLGGLRIESGTGDDPNEPITVLEGLVQDQAQLSGILNTLSGLRCDLLSVNIVKEQNPLKKEKNNGFT